MYKDFKELCTAMNKIGTPEMNFGEFVVLRDWCLNNEEAVKDLVRPYKVDQLKRISHSFHAKKKEDHINAIYDRVLSDFTLSNSVQYNPMEEKYATALRRIIGAVTEAEYIAYCAQQAAENSAHQKALTNPETIAEFHTFIHHKGEAALTSEQKIKWDELNADRSKERKKDEEVRQAVVTEVKNLEGVEMELKHSRHTKKEIPLYVVTLSSRVDRDKYTELNVKAKKLGGYYSSYARDGAIPGFTFEDEEAAKAFMDLKEGNVNASDVTADKRETKVLSQAEQLIAKADEIEAAAKEEMNRERQTNTHKRATQAAHAEEAAAKRILFAQTLRRIAEGIPTGTIKYLDKLRALVELEDLQRILSLTKWRYIRANNVRSEEYEPTIAVVELIEYPYPKIWKENGLSLLMRIQNDKGKKLVAARMMKRLKGEKSDELIVSGTALLEDFKTCFCESSPSIQTYELQRYQNDLKTYTRIKRLGLDTIHELRAALRELFHLMSSADLSDEQKKSLEVKALERKYIGAKIEGFFPTPEDLAEFLVEVAEIKEGDRILEPSAGLGHIAEAINKSHPDNSLKVVEYNSGLAEVLSKKGFETVNTDFLQYSNGGYDRIIMNPPFENLQDIDHVMHAFGMLNEGGRLVAIMAANKSSSRSKIVEFNEFVEKHGGQIIQNEEGSFKDAFRSTGVNTITVILDK
jgi:phospholipid N-methyltransferase